MGTTKVSSFEFHVSSQYKVPWASVAPSFEDTQVLLPRSARRPNRGRGLWVVLLGPDGAGKSSVIAGIGSGAAAGFAGCNTYHLRPTLFRRRRAMGANCDPHGQQVRGMLISVLKLVYLLVANWTGYLAVVRPQLVRGKLILFDRYFPDSLVDPKRYRLPESCRPMAKLVARLLPRPDGYVVLEVPTCVLQERKQEVRAEETERQRKAYARLASDLANAVRVDGAQPLFKVLDEVMDHMIEWHLARRRNSYETA